MSHLGPDGTTDYTCSIAECVDAIFRMKRDFDPATPAVRLEWDANGQKAIAWYVSRNTPLWDPFSYPECTPFAHCSRTMALADVSRALGIGGCL